MGKCVVLLRLILLNEIVGKTIPQKQTFEKKKLKVLTIKPFYRISPTIIKIAGKVWLQPAVLTKQRVRYCLGFAVP